MSTPSIAPDALFLVLNCGSSSVKFAVFTADLPATHSTPLWSGKVQGIGTPQAMFSETGIEATLVPLDASAPYQSALQLILARVNRRRADRPLAAVGHRIVHGGSKYFEPVQVDAAVLDDLRSYIPLAPLHQPFALEAVDILMGSHPELPQIACFDTAFHATLPLAEQLLPLDYDYYRRGVRRYGFHGLSYDYLAHVLPRRHGELARGRVIAAHLGSGASLCAMQNGQSVATSMGFSALDGLMMGTRTGSLDPGVVLYLLETEKLTPTQLGLLLYHQAGLLGVSGQSAEPRVLMQLEARQDDTGERARAAMALYVRRIQREIGALAAVLGGVDLLVFTAGVGENSAEVRRRVVASLGFLGPVLNEQANQASAPVISAPESAVCVAVEPTNEEWMIARHMQERLAVTSGA